MKKIENTNTLHVCPADNAALYLKSIVASPFSWIGKAVQGTIKCQFKARHQRNLDWCHATVSQDGKVVTCEADPISPQRLAAPGQTLALYIDGECLGGGDIVSIENHAN